MNECMAMSCRCCECQGKHCLMWHPGHSHNDGVLDKDLLAITLAYARKANEEWEKIRAAEPQWDPARIEYGE